MFFLYLGLTTSEIICICPSFRLPPQTRIVINYYHMDSNNLDSPPITLPPQTLHHVCRAVAEATEEAARLAGVSIEEAERVRSLLSAAPSPLYPLSPLTPQIRLIHAPVHETFVAGLFPC